MASQEAAPTLPPEAIKAITAERPADAPRRCFICLTDEEPSDPPGSWVDPCPCTLEAHQDCMLSWVTDCERTNKPLQCPVCKSVIEMEGPWDIVVAVNDAIHKRFTKASPLVLFTGVSMGVQFSLQMYGALALWTFAGKDSLMRFMLGRDLVIDARTAGSMHFVRERVWSALVMMNVAPTLLFSQMLPNLSNKIFLPTASLYGMYQIMHDETFFTWPPSPRLALTVLPYVRSVYYNLWREFVLPYEVKLNRQILGLPPVDPNANNGNDAANQRRNDQRNAEPGFVGLLQGILDALDPDDEDDDPQGRGNGVDRIEIVQGNADAGEDGEEGEVMFELRIEEIEEVEENQEAPNAAPIAEQPADEEAQVEGQNEPHVEVQEQEDGAQIAGEDHQGDVAAAVAAAPNPPPEAQDHQGQAQHEVPQAPPARRMGLGTILSSMSNAVVSALILPGVSFAMGEALRLVLPKAWTANASRGPWTMYGGGRIRPGFLQQQWGRSLVGGCLYVVLKDVVRVYTKSRRVAAMGNRRVKNVDRRRGGASKGT